MVRRSVSTDCPRLDEVMRYPTGERHRDRHVEKNDGDEGGDGDAGDDCDVNGDGG